MVRRKLYEVGVVSHVLSIALGAGRQWVDALNDFRQGKADISGLRLYPVAHTGGTPDRAGQPLYSLQDVKAFVQAVRDALGCNEPFPVNALVYEYEDVPGLEPAAWRFRTATPTGASAGAHRGRRCRSARP